jgi:hypothetical protein
VNITNLQTLQNRRDVLVRFHAAYKDTIERVPRGITM